MMILSIKWRISNLSISEGIVTSKSLPTILASGLSISNITVMFSLVSAILISALEGVCKLDVCQKSKGPSRGPLHELNFSNNFNITRLHICLHPMVLFFKYVMLLDLLSHCAGSSPAFGTKYIDITEFFALRCKKTGFILFTPFSFVTPGVGVNGSHLGCGNLQVPLKGLVRRMHRGTLDRLR